MKKILSLVLILALSVCLFAGCGEQPTNPTVAGATVEDAAEYLYAMYKENNGTVARRDFSVVAAVMIEGVTYPIEWTTDAPDFVTIGAAENNMVKIDIVEEPAEEVNFKLIGTVKDEAGNTASVTLTRVIEAKKVTGIEFVAAPVAGTAYKFALVQNNLGQTLYFTGAMSGYYLGTSANPFDAVDVYVEDVDGGQRIFFTSAEGVKTYIDVVPRGADNPGKVNIVLTEAPTCVYTWDAERKTFTTTVEENTWYIGTYNTYNTMSASLVKYIENMEVIGATQFPAGFCTVNIVASQVATPAVDTAYKFAVVQNGLGQTLYFTGAMNGYYLGTSVNPAEGINIFVENVEGGQRLYFLKGETKVYIDVVPRGADNPGKVNVILTETPSCVFTWDAERKTFVTNTVADNTWYLGCYGTYNTISASLIKYIENVEVIGDTQFPAGPYIVEGFMDMQPDLDKHEHTAAEAVKENEKSATCTEDGSYESVVYCSECKEEISREKKTVAAAGHTPAEAVQENMVGGGCGEAGSYDSVVYCSVCNAEVSRETVEIPATGDHNYITETERKEPTCTEAGFVKKACSCGAETTEELPAAHTEGEAVKENEVAPTPSAEGSYDSVVYCTVCNAEVSREVVAIPKLEGMYVYIFYAEAQKYCTPGAADRNRLKGEDTPFAWLVEIDENGYYIFSADGKYMTSGASGNSMSMEDELTDCARWERIECANGVYLRNVGANYNGNYNQYMEYYYDFTTYGFNESKANIYTFQLIEVV